MGGCKEASVLKSAVYLCLFVLADIPRSIYLLLHNGTSQASRV